MSCYIIPTEQLDFILDSISQSLKNDSYIYFADDLYISGTNLNDLQSACNSIKKVLTTENYRSVNYRYNTNEMPSDSEFIYRLSKQVKLNNTLHNIIQANQYLNNYVYQASECKNYKESLANHYVNVIRKYLADYMMNYLASATNYDLEWGM